MFRLVVNYYRGESVAVKNKGNWKRIWPCVLLALGIVAISIGFGAGTDTENGSWIIGGPLMGAGIIMAVIGCLFSSKYEKKESSLVSKEKSKPKKEMPPQS
jgi:hypothetical protein